MTLEAVARPDSTPGGDPLAEALAPVEGALRGTLTSLLQGCPDEIVSPLRTAVLAPGKRIRPLLLIAAYRAARGSHEAVYRLACSVELVHAYSLIHDDLPCMDDDVLRRGLPTLHVRYGSGVATLAGASLMPVAIETILSAASAMGCSNDQKRTLVRELARASGGAGMVGGQLRDLRAEGRSVSRSELERIHLGKTARLMEAAVVMGVTAAGGGEELARQLRRFGRHLGLAFQVVDDILDMTGNASVMGKTGRRDEALGKATTPVVLGMTEARRLGKELAERARRDLEGLGRADELREILEAAVDRER
jgi:geranylgeranyl pyrophosphate synthase